MILSVALMGFGLSCSIYGATAPLLSAKYSVTQLPISSQSLWEEVDGENSQLVWYPVDAIHAKLRNILQKRHDANIFGLDGGDAVGLLFLPDNGPVQIMIEAQSSVVNSNTLITLLDNKVMDQVLIDYEGPDSEQVICFSLDKNFLLTLKFGESDTEDDERTIIWKDTKQYQIDVHGKINEL